MPERARDFRTPTEVEAARPKLNRDCSVSLTEFAGLVGHYYFQRADWVRCQLEPKPGSVCRQEHGDGWIARRKDGAEVFIGGDCAQKYFGADRTFATEASRVRREIRVDDLVARLNALIDDPAFGHRVESLTVRFRQLRDQVSAAREEWPQFLLHRLYQMVKTGNRSVTVEFRYVEVEEDGSKHTEWQPAVLGSIVGSEGLDIIQMRRLAERLHEVERTLVTAAPSRDLSEAKLRGWLGTLQDVDQCERELDETAASLAAFNTPENLRLLCWLIRADLGRLDVVRRVLEREGQLRPSNALVRTTLANWAAEIRASNEGRDFRVA